MEVVKNRSSKNTKRIIYELLLLLLYSLLFLKNTQLQSISIDIKTDQTKWFTILPFYYAFHLVHLYIYMYATIVKIYCSRQFYRTNILQ